MKYFLILLLVWNVFVFVLYGLDKYKAKKSLRRTPEKYLLLSSFLLGAPAAIFAIVIFNHKTSKMKFRILIPLFVVINILILYAILK
ncbi:MAG: DUF1294 domain-containing protein [Clostridia bacterium]|nr:DUF1294 domain-containing protein [Clostridia bacterium]